MDPNSPEALFDALRASGLYTPDQLAPLADTPTGDPTTLAEILHERGLLTGYQARKVRVGRVGELIVGPYLILDKIGEGGMGKVFKAIRHGNEVALKIVRANLMANKVVRGRYYREAKAAAALKHPNIVALHDADEATGRYYLAMEFVNGSDLSRLVKEFGPLPYQEACEYVRQAALGLQHAHDQGMVHRDVKPSNLLVTGERALPGTGGRAVVKILDMGLVRTLTDADDLAKSELTRDGTVVGTPDYMAPEQAKNSSTVDHRADLYSLGCTLFMLVTGKPPFVEGTAIDKLLRHQLDVPPDLRTVVLGVPGGVADVVKRLLAKKAADRFQSASEVAAALAPYTSEPPTPPPPPRREGRGHRPRKPIPGGSTAVTVQSGPLAATARQTAESPVGTRRPRTPVAIAPPSLAPISSTSLSPPPDGPLDAEPMDAEVMDAEPVSRAFPRPTPRRPKPARKAKANGPGLVMWAGVAVGVLVVAGVVALALRPGPPKETPPPPPPPAPAARVMEPLPGAMVDLPDQTVACVVVHPQAYWKRTPADGGPGLAGLVARFASKYRFDVRKCDRLVAATPIDGNGKFVLVGEGPDFLGWAAGLEQSGAARPTTRPGGHAILSFRGPDDLYGAGITDRGAAVGTDPDALAAAAAHAAEKRAPAGLKPAFVAALPDYGESPLAVAVATGEYFLPGVGPLGAMGVSLAVVRVRLADDGFAVDAELTGPDARKLGDFAREVLGERLPKERPVYTPFVRALKAGDPIPAAGGAKLKLTGKWDAKQFHLWVESLVP